MLPGMGLFVCFVLATLVFNGRFGLHGHLLRSLETICDGSYCMTSLGVQDGVDHPQEAVKFNVVSAQLKSLQLVTIVQPDRIRTAISSPQAVHSTPVHRCESSLAVDDSSFTRYEAQTVAVVTPANVAWPILSLSCVATTLYAQDSSGMFQYHWGTSKVYRIFSRRVPKIGAASSEPPFHHNLCMFAAHFAALHPFAADRFRTMYQRTRSLSSDPDHCIVACENRDLILFAVSSTGDNTPPAVVHTVAYRLDFDCTSIAMDPSRGVAFLLDAGNTKVLWRLNLCVPGSLQVCGS